MVSFKDSIVGSYRVPKKGEPDKPKELTISSPGLKDITFNSAPADPAFNTYAVGDPCPRHCTMPNAFGLKPVPARLRTIASSFVCCPKCGGTWKRKT